MGKLLSWVVMLAVGFLVWRLIGVLQRKAARRAADRDKGTGRGTGKAITDERMVQCAHCGVHVPSSEALVVRGQSYCCPEHRDADRAA